MVYCCIGCEDKAFLCDRGYHMAGIHVWSGSRMVGGFPATAAYGFGIEPPRQRKEYNVFVSSLVNSLNSSKPSRYWSVSDGSRSYNGNINDVFDEGSYLWSCHIFQFPIKLKVKN